MMPAHLVAAECDVPIVAVSRWMAKFGTGRHFRSDRGYGGRIRLLDQREQVAFRLWRMLDGYQHRTRAVHAYLADPNPNVLVTADRAATFLTPEAMLATWECWGRPPAAMVRLEAS